MAKKKQKLVEHSDVSWGGPWTEKKLDAFMDYLKAYLTIMKKYRQWKTIYFDGFAGAGETVKNKRNDLLEISFDEESSNDLEVYKGSVKRVLEEKELTFDYYYFIDTNPDNIKRIRELKSTITHINSKHIIERESDCNAQLPLLANALKSNNYAALIFIDPFGMNINWDSIATLKDTRSDIWILIPSGVAINRLLPRSGNLNRNRLEQFFGLTVDEIQAIFYSTTSTDDLFGGTERTTKVQKPIEKIVEVYSKQLKTIWKEVSKPLILKNTKGAPIFHLLFASNSKAGLKIASHIVDKKN